MTTLRTCILCTLLLALFTLTACSDETIGMEPPVPQNGSPDDPPVDPPDDPDQPDNPVDPDDPSDRPLASGSGQFRHIETLAFTRGLNYRIPAGGERDAVEQWLADRLDINEGDLGVRDHDPDVEIFRYALDLTAITPDDDLPTDEEAYLHFAEETVIQYRDLSGHDVGAPVTIPGCPPDGPPTAESRLHLYMWDSYRYAFDPSDESFRTWQTDHLLAGMGLDYDGVFLDEHSPGFKRGLYMNQSRIISGGAIREFDGLRPTEPNLPGKNYTELCRRYSGAVVDWLTYLRSQLECTDKFMLINPAQYYWIDLSENEWIAAGGVTLELVHTPFNWSSSGFGGYAEQVRRGLDAGVRMDLNGDACYSVPSDFVSENYPDGDDRYRMWRLAGYYYVRGAPDSPGTAYFDLSFCRNNDSLQDYIDEWADAYEYDIGDPLDDGRVVSSGESDCSGSYRIYARDYTFGTVLVRPQDNYGCDDFGTATRVEVRLTTPMRMLRADGTLSDAMTSVGLCNSEAVILIGDGSVE